MRAHAQANAQDAVLHNPAKPIRTIKALVGTRHALISNSPKNPEFQNYNKRLSTFIQKNFTAFSLFKIKFTYLHSYETLTLIFHLQYIQNFL